MPPAGRPLGGGVGVGVGLAVALALGDACGAGVADGDASALRSWSAGVAPERSASSSTAIPPATAATNPTARGDRCARSIVGQSAPERRHLVVAGPNSDADAPPNITIVPRTMVADLLPGRQIGMVVYGRAASTPRATRI